MSSPRKPRIYVLAGVNGAGKSSIVGAAFRQEGGEYFNPDEAARRWMAADPARSQTDVNAQAWREGVRLLERAIEERLDFAFETTLGANTIPRLLKHAASQGIEINVWYAGLSSPQLHIERVRARVRRGGHDIPEEHIRRRYEHSRLISSNSCPASQPCVFTTTASMQIPPPVVSRCPSWCCTWSGGRSSTRATSGRRRTGQSRLSRRRSS